MQWMEDENELSMRTPRSLTTFETCMEGKLEWRNTPGSGIIAFGGIDRLVPIY